MTKGFGVYVQEKHVPLPEELDARLKAFRRDDDNDDDDDGGLQGSAGRRKKPQNLPPTPHASVAARVRHVEFHHSPSLSLSALVRHCVEYADMSKRTGRCHFWLH